MKIDTLHQSAISRGRDSCSRLSGTRGPKRLGTGNQSQPGILQGLRDEPTATYLTLSDDEAQRLMQRRERRVGTPWLTAANQFAPISLSKAANVGRVPL